MPDPNTIPFREADGNGHYQSKQLPQDKSEFLEALGLPAFAGDVISASPATVGGEVATYWSTDGHTIKAATQTGLAKLTAGVLSSVTAPVGTVVGTTDVQTLTNKTIQGAIMTGATGLTPADVGLGNVDNTSDVNKPISNSTQAALNNKENKAEKGVTNGYASLDVVGKVPMSQIPDAVIGASRYLGTWNAATNTPTIPAAAPGNQGYYYSVAVGGSTSIDGISAWAIGDTIISNGSIWQKIPVSNAVQSVNGKTGIVVVNKSDVGLGNADNTSDATKNAAAATLTNKIIDGTNNTLNVRLGTTDVSGNLPVSHLASGSNASQFTFWRGDGQWVSPLGGGDVTGAAASVEGEMPLFTGTSGKALKRCSVDGFVKATTNGAAVGQAQMGATDLSPTVVSGQPNKTTVKAGDRLLIWDAATSTLQSILVSVFQPVGMIVSFAGSTAPVGWLLCFGQLVNRTTYAALFSAIGTAYGAGDGSTTFGIPDLRGYTVAGKGDMGGTGANRVPSFGATQNLLGGAGGADTHTITTAQMASHSHVYYSNASGSGLAFGSNINAYYGLSTDVVGSNAAHNNMQPTMILNRIIFTGV